jgi:hypothetical protein
MRGELRQKEVSGWQRAVNVQCALLYAFFYFIPHPSSLVPRPSLIPEKHA